MKLKIGIYAPCKNELKHLNDWYNSCKEANYIKVADTGSTDGSREKLISLGVDVTDLRLMPWRFDYAFNFAMSLLPDDTDVCIRLDMDERLQPGWREHLERVWSPQTTKLRYPYVWDWVSPGIPGRKWYSDRIHARNGYQWRGYTHEGLCSRLPEVETYTDDVQIWQFPDAKDKKNDLPLLIECCNEWPTDSRLKAYLGREYLYQGQFDMSIKTYKEFLAMSYDRIERGHAMINLSKADNENKVFWLKMSAIETPHHREPLVELANHYYETKEWHHCYEYAKKALEITNHPMDYTCEPSAWGYLPHDLLSIAAWNMGLYIESAEQSELALKCQPSDQRLKKNYELVTEFLTKNGIKS